MPRLFFRVLTSLWCGLVTAPGLLGGDPPPDTSSPAYWASQLSHPHYLRRETAEQRLTKAGPKAVKVLGEALLAGDLEVIERASSILTSIAIANHPTNDGGAWDTLSKVRETSTGLVGNSTSRLIDEIRAYRSARAVQALTAAGVFVGQDEVMIRAVSERRMLVQIDKTWNRDLAALDWLRWLDNVQTARIRGSALRADVLRRVVEMPELESLALADGQLGLQDVRPLEKLSEIRSIEIRYIQLNEPELNLLASLPVRDSVWLQGTSISSRQEQRIRAAMPGVDINVKAGGFLGVKCQGVQAECQISAVVRESAAEAGGLIPRDVILQIGDRKIETFKDLQEEIAKYPAGKQLKIQYRRADKVESTTVTLKQFSQT